MHTGYLVYEGVYNNQAAPIDAFQNVDVLSKYIWATGSLQDAFSNYTRTAADWVALDPNLRVYGLSTGVGSGWDGTFDGSVDNITYGTRTGGTTTFNLETNAVTPVAVTPEPTTFVMVGSGLAAMSGMVRRRFRRA